MDSKDAIEIMLKEYETLREEVLAAMSNRNSILSFGLAIIGAIFTASIATHTKTGYSILASYLLILAVPAVTNCVLFIWLGEYQRSQRAGKFLVGLEKRINAKAQEELLTWETLLRKQLRHMKYPYDITVMLLTVISVISLIIGLVTLRLYPVYMWVLAIGGVILHVVIYGYVVSRMSKLRL